MTDLLNEIEHILESEILDEEQKQDLIQERVREYLDDYIGGG